MVNLPVNVLAPHSARSTNAAHYWLWSENISFHWSSMVLNYGALTKHHNSCALVALLILKTVTAYHWPSWYIIELISPGKMAIFLKTIFSDAFLWVKRLIFWLKWTVLYVLHLLLFCIVPTTHIKYQSVIVALVWNNFCWVIFFNILLYLSRCSAVYNIVL